MPILLRTSEVAASGPQATRAYREAEDVLAATIPAPGRLLLPPLAERLEEPVSWRRVYDLGDETGRGRVHLFEGQVTYSTETITAGQVWLRQPAGEQVAYGDLALSGDVQKAGVTRVPLGRVGIAGRSFLFVEAHFYGGEAFEIHEWRSTAPQPIRVFERHGGGC